jgi:plasmid stabilization system protein ParE
MANVIWRAEALADLDGIADYIEGFDPLAAKRIRAALIDCGASLSVFPRRGRPRGGELREMATVAPYVLSYLVHDQIVEIVELRHGAKLPRVRP